MSMPLSQRHHCHCHGSHHEQYHRFHRHCHHQGRSGPLPLCLLLCNFHQNKQNIKVCFLRMEWKSLDTEIFSVIQSVESVWGFDFCFDFFSTFNKQQKCNECLISGRFVIFPLHFWYCFPQPTMVHKLSSPIVPCSSFARPNMVTSDQISIFFQYIYRIYRHNSLELTQFHFKPSSTMLYWPSTTKYQPVLPHTDPTSPWTKQYRPVLTQYHKIPTRTAPYWLSTTLYLPNTIKYQPVPLHTDSVPPCTNQHHLLLTQYHHISYLNVRLSFVDLRWAQLYDSLVWFTLLVVYALKDRR